MRNAIQATASRKISKVPFLLSTTLIVRLSRPCGARIATIATVATRIATFANHGFIALPHCPRYIACLANVKVDAAARFHSIPIHRDRTTLDAKHPDSSGLRSNELFGSALSFTYYVAVRAFRRHKKANSNITTAIISCVGNNPAPTTNRSTVRISASKPIRPRKAVSMYQRIFMQCPHLADSCRTLMRLSGSPTQLRIKATQRRVRSKRLLCALVRHYNFMWSTSSKLKIFAKGRMYHFRPLR